MKKNFFAELFLSISILSVSIPAQAAAYIISQTQSFSLDNASHPFIDERGANDNGQWSNGQYTLTDTQTIDVPFYGAPSSLVLAGNTLELTDVTYNLSADLTYTFQASCESGAGMFTKCGVVAGYGMNHVVSADGLILPGQDTTLATDGQVLEASDHETFGLSQGYDFVDGTVPIQQSYALNKDSTDLGFLDVDNFDVVLQRNLYMQLYAWDSGDDNDYISLDNYLLNGDINIKYDYNPVPTAVTPIPGTFWLFGTGLACLIRFRGKWAKGDGRLS